MFRIFLMGLMGFWSMGPRVLAQSPAGKEWRTLFGIPPYYHKEQFINFSLVASDGSSVHALVHEINSLGCDYPHYGIARVSADGQLRWIKPSCACLSDYGNTRIYEDYLGRFVVAGGGYCHQSFATIVYCVDTSGQTQYCRGWGGYLPYSGFSNSVSFINGTPTRDGGFVFCGYQNIAGYGISPNSGYGSYIYRLGPDGDSLWKIRQFLPDSIFDDNPPSDKRVGVIDILENSDSTLSALVLVRLYYDNQPTIRKLAEIRLSKEGNFLRYRPLLIPGWVYTSDGSASYFIKKKYDDRKIVLCATASDKPNYDKQILLEYDTSGQVLWTLNLYKSKNRGVAYFVLPDSTIYSITTYPNGYIHEKPAHLFYKKRFNLEGYVLGEEWEESRWEIGGLWYNLRTVIFPPELIALATTPDSCLIFGGTGRENALLTFYERGIYYVEKRCGNVFLNNHDQAESPDGEDMTPLLGYDAATGAPVPVVYPNPGSGQYHLGYTEPLQRLRVWDGRGALILDGRPAGNRFSLQGLPAGLYLWEATDTQGRTHRGKLMQQTE